MIQSLHLEPTSRCTLACPGCERTVFLNKFKKKNFDIVDIDPTILDNFIDVPVRQINLCGNLGDPIYHSNFEHLITTIKNKNINVSITTNGCYRSNDWWDSLLSLLDENDNITFSIDGTFENFHNYRVNADATTLKNALIKAGSAKVKTTWKCIVFDYNENQIDEIRDLSTYYRIDKFVVHKSDRWNEDTEKFKPSDNSNIGPRNFVQNVVYKKDKNYQNIEINPKCKNNAEHYISSKGFYSPCCYSSNYEFYYKSEWYKNKDLFDIQKTKLSNCIDYFNNFFDRIQTERPNYCVFNCGKCE